MSRKGFSLVEILIVIVVLAVLAGMIFGMMGVIGSAKVSLTQTRIHGIRCEVSKYAALKGQPPAKLEDLAAKLDQSGWMLDGKFVDAWDQPLQYRVNGKEFKLWSVGPDGKSGTPDDIEYLKN
jgi:general secretion pathway protein G